MCGISCVVVLNGQNSHPSQKDRDRLGERLDKSLQQIRHRGPDSNGKWISKNGRVGRPSTDTKEYCVEDDTKFVSALGHTRLEINDLSTTGSQPLHSTDGLVHAVVNGEIYDFSKLRAEMEVKLEYRFQGTSDSELVLALYQFYGLSFVSKLRGEFSVCLYDSARELFVAVRDRYGIKPLFWTIQNGELLVAAEMKAFLPLGWQPEWDVHSIVEGDIQISNCTVFKNVRKVRPGYMLVCRNFGFVNEQQYWHSDYPDKHVKEIRTEEEMIQGVRDRLLDAVKQRLRADVKVGVSLSGGIDSSTVAGMVNHLLREGHQIGSEIENERLSCFGIAFDEESGFDESEIANRTAEFLNVKFYKKHMNEQELSIHFEEATWICEQVNYDLNFVGVYALSALFREKGFTVNINGQGSDEIFGGYNIFLPDFLREPDFTFTSSSIEDSERCNELARIEKQLQEIYSNRLNLNSKTAARHQLNHLLTPQQMTCAFADTPIKPAFLPAAPIDFEQTYAESIPVNILEKIQHKWHPLHGAQYIFVSGHLQNLILSHLGDRGEMANSVEGRTPFLDHQLTEYVNNLPPSMKIRRDPKTGEWIEKYILREVAKPFITGELYTRRKHPYSAPLDFPIGGPMYLLLKELVTSDNLEKLGWIETEGMNRLVDEAFETKDKLKFKLACSLAQWVVLHRRFGVKKAVPDHQVNGVV